jgi:hypothetical protein
MKIADAKGLMPAGHGRCQQLGAGRQIECLAVPVKDDFSFSQAREERIAESGIRKIDRRPADFSYAVGVNSRAESLRD